MKVSRKEWKRQEVVANLGQFMLEGTGGRKVVRRKERRKKKKGK